MILKKNVIEKLKEVKDPEIGIDIWTLGLIYSIEVSEGGVNVQMTLTTPFCPFADQMILNAEKSVSELLENKSQNVRIELTFEPPWKPSDEIRAKLGLS